MSCRLSKACLLLALGFFLYSRSSNAASVRLLVSIGSNIGDPDDPPLRYADSDARRMVSLFVDIGNVSSDRAYLVTDQTAEVVRQRLAEVAGRIAELSKAGHEVVLFVYVSSHARSGELHLRGTRLPLTELRDYAANVQARLRVLMIDSCDSGAIARQKGGMPGPEYEVALERIPLAGQVIISSSGPAEPSQEWDSLGGSLFTHHWLTGLRGDADADGDGKVTVAEAYSYAYRRTLVGAANVTQHPAFDWDLTGSGELVLSEPSSAKSALLFPAQLEGRYVVASQPRPDVVAEIEKRPGKLVRLAVPPGRYSLRKLLGKHTGLLNIDLPYGGERVVDESQMVRRHFAEVAVKGGYVELHPSAVLAFGNLQNEQLAGTGIRWHAGGAYRRTWGEYWGMIGLGFGVSNFRGNSLSTSETSLSLSVSGGYRWLLNPLVPYLGASIELLGVRQTFQRDQESTIQQVFGAGPLPARTALGVSGGPLVGVELPLFGRSFTMIYLQGLARYLPAEGQSSFSLGVQAGLGIGATF